jgi:hypothetical protein
MEGRRKRRAPADRVHFRIDREHEASWAAFRQHGCEQSAAAFPAIRGLLEACQEASRSGYRFPGRTFSYRGRRYPVTLTSFGRVVVRHPETGRDIGATGFFSAW